MCTPTRIQFEGNSVRARFETTDDQIKARDAIERALNPDPANPTHVVALSLLPRTPAWLAVPGRFAHVPGSGFARWRAFHAAGGHARGLAAPHGRAGRRPALGPARERRAPRRHHPQRHGRSKCAPATPQTLEAARGVVQDQFPDLAVVDCARPTAICAWCSTSSRQRPCAVQDQALKQNMTTLHNRINELGVSEPVIQQQGVDRIVVQLPGVQDTAKAKDILGRTATLEMRLVDESTEGRAAADGSGPVPFGSDSFPQRDGRPAIVKKQVLTTGENLTDAQAGFDSRDQQPSVTLVMDAAGGRIMRDVSRENLNKGMAIILFEKGKGEAISVATIRGELGNRFQISGNMGINEANDLALLLRAGSLAAPMEIIEERTIGPSLGADNIAKGFNSVMWGFAVIVAFMCAYYMLFGAFSSLALGLNLLLLVAVLSMLQATLTLPGIAAMALALGMAIDSNVLINERVREELRNGASPQSAINAGYDHAWGTILDSNITTLIAGVALLIFGSGPVRGFAVVHCIGILTSMFSSVFFSRGLVNFWYGRQKKLKTVSIGTVWRAGGSATTRQLSKANKPARRPITREPAGTNTWNFSAFNATSRS